MSKAEILAIHRDIGSDIEARLEDFRNVWREGSDEDIFAELVFCLLTPQSKARTCWGAVEAILDEDLLIHGGHEQILDKVSCVRFKNNKTRYILEARQTFSKNNMNNIKNIINNFDDPRDARDWLVENVKGMGMKEASHFLRNIGMGAELAILDRHILKNLVILGVIPDIPKSLSPKRYLAMEAAMVEFAAELGIPPDHLDIVLWYKEAGEIFK